MKKEMDHEWKESLSDQARRKQKFEKEKGGVLRHTTAIGMIGTLFMLPVVGGAYLGEWLDRSHSGYCLSWTVNLILLGVVWGALNVVLFIKERYR